MVMGAAEAMAHAGAWGGHGGWWPIFPIFWVLFWVVLIVVLVRSRRSWGRWNAGNSAEGVLAERYARGEISVEEYRERLGVLKESHSR